MKHDGSEKTFVWAIYFVGFNDAQSPAASPELDDTVEPHVGFERVETTADPAQQRSDADLTALLRGGQVLAIVEDDDESTAAAVASALEKEILRLR